MPSAADEICVTGRLFADAALKYTATNPAAAVLSFDIHPAKGLPYFIRHPVGTDPSAQIAAAAKVRLLRKGCMVRVFAAGARFQHDHEVAGIRMLDVSSVITQHTAAPHCEAHSKPEREEA